MLQASQTRKMESPLNEETKNRYSYKHPQYKPNPSNYKEEIGVYTFFEANPFQFPAAEARQSTQPTTAEKSMGS